LDLHVAGHPGIALVKDSIGEGASQLQSCVTRPARVMKAGAARLHSWSIGYFVRFILRIVTDDDDLGRSCDERRGQHASYGGLTPGGAIVSRDDGAH
jgi:hypothetical protein